MKKTLFIITFVLSCTAQATALSVIPVQEELYKKEQKAVEQGDAIEPSPIQKNSQQIIIEKLEVLHQDLVKIHAALLANK